jgi:hypothetical protein
MAFRPRLNRLAAQRLDAALVYKEMLGIDEAMAFLQRENVPENIAERVLCSRSRRHVFEAGAQYPEPAPTYTGCRRRNHVHAAIIEASLTIEGKLGDAWARTLLSNENVPAHVAERILAQGPRQLRAKSPGAMQRE